jgi:hypothetical protein
MSEINIDSKNRIEIDKKDKVLRSFFNDQIDNNIIVDDNKKVMSKSSQKNFALETLEKNAQKFFKSTEDLKNIKETRVIEGINTYSARYIQEFKGVPVHDSEIIVNFNQNGQIQSLYNNYHYGIPSELDPKNILITKDEATKIVNDLFKSYSKYEIGEPNLLIYQYFNESNLPPRNSNKIIPKRKEFLSIVYSKLNQKTNKEIIEGKYFLIWDFVVVTENPLDKWRIMIDTFTGNLINVIDLKQYSSKGKVFNPNPAVTTGDITLSSSSPLEVLENQCIDIELYRLDPPNNGSYYLDGKYVKMLEIESPEAKEPVEPSGNFVYSCNDHRFLNVMVYYHIDNFQNYLQNHLDLFNICNFSLEVDPQGLNGDDNSHYSPPALPQNPIGRPYLAFGEGGVRDAEDAQVILHEYGHAIQDNCNPGFNNPRSGVGEGFGDILAAIYYDDKHKELKTRGLMFSWDASPFGSPAAFWPGRRYDIDWLFDGPEYTSWYNHKDQNGRYDGMHMTGQLWCATIFELYRKLGGDSNDEQIRSATKNLILRLHLMANFTIPTINAKAYEVAQQIEAADNNLGNWRYPNGIHRKVIYDTFSRRHLEQFPPREIDVYIDDGRNGGYGSVSGQDLFSEKLWKGDYWDTKDIWSKNSPYPDEISRSQGNSSDHEQPTAGETAYLYVKVKNRGKTSISSGKVEIQAFHSTKGKESKFPEDYVSIGKIINQDNISSDSENGIVIGPFPYKHTQDNESIIIVVECEEDPSIIKNINSPIKCEDFVSFDNNIGMRIL